MGAAVGKQVLGVALLVVQRTQKHAGPPQLSRCDRPGSVRDVRFVLSRQQQHLTVLTKFLVIQWQGGKFSEPNGQNITLQSLLLSYRQCKICIKETWYFLSYLLQYSCWVKGGLRDWFSASLAKSLASDTFYAKINSLFGIWSKSEPTRKIISIIIIIILMLYLCCCFLFVCFIFKKNLWQHAFSSSHWKKLQSFLSLHAEQA